MHSENHAYRLVGCGPCTAGLVYELIDQVPVVLGRQADCSIALSSDAEGHKDGPLISRVHAVIEPTPHGWCVYDSGSTNGTALLRQGLPPTVPLEVPRHYPLDSGDVIELAGSPDYQLLFQRVPRASGEPVTQQLFLRSGRSVQQLADGHAIGTRDVTSRGLRVYKGPSGACWLAPDTDDADAVLRIRLVDGKTVATAVAPGFRLNLAPLALHVEVELKDKDLLVADADPTAAFLYLDPASVEPRRLSDVLLGSERTTLGCATDNTCRLSDPSISRHHAVIWRAGSELRVRDLDAVNGTTLDGRRITQDEPLRIGQRLLLGRLAFVVDSACWEAAVTRDVAIDIAFCDVSVEIAGKLRLRDVSLRIGQGEMVGVLGPSASGKSTLLRALAGQQPLSSGDILVNGRSVRGAGDKRRWFEGMLGFGPDTREVGFVQQIDLLQPDLTVREILQFAARHMGLANDEARARADKAGELCNLGTLLDRVAISGTGQMNLSGGQLKRVCVALEILRQPRVLVLDEPTTGQDPKNTDDLMRLFRALAQQRVTLLMSTHDLRNLALFDTVIVVALGHLVYVGPGGTFAEYFGADSAEEVYRSLPDREDRLAEAEQLAARFRGHPLYSQFCGYPS